MTSADSSLTPDNSPPPAATVAATVATAIAAEIVPSEGAPTFWDKFEARLDLWGDHLNPILVKEARQAMKSRQFIVTFSLLLIFGWIWTILFVSFGVPFIFYNPAGPAMLIGYYLLLTIPLLIVVPYAAFRSLAAEQEDGTYELLSITTLTARQIVLGKLGSALLQMMVYYSALAPCIAFTYLLRGIDVLTIGMHLFYTFLASLLLSVIGLLLATITRSRMWQVLLSVVLVMALLVITLVWNIALLSALGESDFVRVYDQPEFWISLVAGLMFYTAFIVLFLFIAAGQITFASENRSTRVRWVLLVIQMLWIAWSITLFLYVDEEEALVASGIFAGLFWSFAGAILSSETAELSPRARRELPQSLVGRLFLTWMNPGSGTGYIMTSLAIASYTFTMVAVGLVHDSIMFTSSGTEWWSFQICMASYVIGYLGVTRLFVAFLRRFTRIPILPAFLLQVVGPIFGILIPLMLQAMLTYTTNQQFDYSMLQITNWMWTLVEVADGGAWGISNVVVTLASVASVIFLANLIQASGEVQVVRLVAPERVLSDDAALLPAPKKPKSPWDE